MEKPVDPLYVTQASIERVKEQLCNHFQVFKKMIALGKGIPDIIETIDEMVADGEFVIVDESHLQTSANRVRKQKDVKTASREAWLAYEKQTGFEGLTEWAELTGKIEEDPKTSPPQG